MIQQSEQVGPLLISQYARRDRTIGRLCKAAGGLVYDVPFQEAAIDERLMAVGPVTISTPALDRDGDVLVPTGVVLDNYARNPVVYWDHGLSGEDGGTLPIASSGDAMRGELAVEVDSDSVKAISFFHGETRLSAQVFSLIVKGAIRAASVRPMPISTRLVSGPDGDPVLIMDEWELVEWSWCGIGVNHEALLKCLRDGRIDGECLAAPLRKTFAGVTPPKKPPRRKQATWPTLGHLAAKAQLDREAANKALTEAVGDVQSAVVDFRIGSVLKQAIDTVREISRTLHEPLKVHHDD